MFLCEKHLKGHFRLNGRCWRLFVRPWSVEEGPLDAWTGARAPTRASKAEEEGGKALKGAEHQREGTRTAGAARFTSHESRQHRAAACARARQVTVLPVVGACRSGAHLVSER